MQGVSGISNFDEGFASLNLNLVPSEQAGLYQFWYDRASGKDNPVRSDDALLIMNGPAQHGPYSITTRFITQLIPPALIRRW